MRLNSKHTAEELERYIQMYLNEGISFKELSETFGLLISASAFSQKVLRYQEYGLKGIQTKSRNNRYSEEFKQCVINEYLVEGLPFKQLARKYNIPNQCSRCVRNSNVLW